MATIEWRTTEIGETVRHSAYVGDRVVAEFKERVEANGSTVMQIGTDIAIITLDEARERALKLAYQRALRARAKADEILQALDEVDPG